MQRAKLIAVLAMLVAPAIGHPSQTLLYDDFQDRDSEGWRGFGDGDIRITEYQGNASLRLSQGAVVARQVVVKNSARVRVGASFAAADLGENGACVAEMTMDEGSSWTDVSRVTAGQDDGITLHSSAISRVVPAPVESVWLRARSLGESERAWCWLDRVYVIGERGPEAAEETRQTRILGRAFMLGQMALDEPVAMQEFTQPSDASAPLHEFSGSLQLHDTASVAQMNIVADEWGRQSDVGDALAHLPEFDFQFVQDGHDLLPLQRGVQRRKHPYWEIILQPGRVWNASDDDGWTRAAMPFSLQERGANCTHNGVLSWLYNAQNVSRVAYQISSETCSYLKFDMWGMAAADYEKSDLENVSQPHVERFRKHVASRLPVRDFAQLAKDHPGVEPLGFGVDDGIHPDDLTVVGFVVDGIHYRSNCNTRHGPYPFCDSMPLPSYSTAKSIFAAVALMRMENLYPGSSEVSIAALVDDCKPNIWRDVSLENALDMATGNYHSTKPENDEDAKPSLSFIFDDMHKSKLDFSCNHYKRKSKPGSQFVYHTSDTYLLGTALAELQQQRTGAKDIYRDLLVDPIWHHMQLSPLLDESKRTYDNAAQPLVGYGLTYEADDIVRIADWLNREDGRIDAVPLLDTAMLKSALQRSEGDRGLDTGYPNLKYSNGFWAYNAGPSLGCKGAAWVPFMSGVSGITVALFPNKITYYYFSDSLVYRWGSAREAAHKIKDLCR